MFQMADDLLDLSLGLSNILVRQKDTRHTRPWLKCPNVLIQCCIESQGLPIRFKSITRLR